LTELLAQFQRDFRNEAVIARRINRLPGRKKQTGDDPREQLWSIARRISERQKATIAREWAASSSAGGVAKRSTW
jgi:hypothetical protein